MAEALTRISGRVQRYPVKQQSSHWLGATMIGFHRNFVFILVSIGGLTSCSTYSSSSRLSDREHLLALHAEVMEAHRTNSVDLFLQSEAEDYVVANRGEISHPTIKERRDRLGPYLSTTQFTHYADAIPPIVVVSRDGSLGWVIVQVKASGARTAATGAIEPLSFESAWIELYEKRAGIWRRVGNVSNFKP